jgi:hypothetical protein
MTTENPAASVDTQSAEQQAGIIEQPGELDVIRQINKAISENTTQADIRISRLAIAQPLTPEVAQQVPGFEAGMIFDNLTREVLSTKGLPPWLLLKGVNPQELKPVHYLPIALNFKLPSEYIKWIAKDDQVPGGDRWEFKTLDPKDERVVNGIWESQGGNFVGPKPPVTINTNYLLLALDLELRMPLGYFRVGTFSRSSAPCGQTIASILQAQAMQNQRPWDRVFYLHTVRHDKPQVHYVLQIARGSLLKDAVEPFVADMCFQMGRELTDPAKGKIFQTIIINSANLDEGHADGGVSTGNPTGKQSPEDDPFTAPLESNVQPAAKF